MEYKCENFDNGVVQQPTDIVQAAPTQLYPTLPAVSASAPPSVYPAHGYRLQKIGEIQKELEQERNKRATLSKKYHRSIKIVGGLDNVLVVSTMGLGVAGIGVLSTIIAAPVAIAMEGAALGCGALSIISTQVNRKLMHKAEKHEKIKVLAESKLNTIDDHISKALIDGFVDDSEFSMILCELKKFKEMKQELRVKTRSVIDEETKNTLIEQGRSDAVKKFRNCLEGTELLSRRSAEN